MAAVAYVLAHQGGWDEVLLVAGPIVLFALLLRRANRRAEQHQRKVSEAQPTSPDPDGDSGP